MQMELIETRRLTGESVRESHLYLWRQIGSNRQVMATLGGVWTSEKASQKIQWNCEQWKLHGHGQWTFFDRTNKEFAGRGGIRKVVVNDREEVELGYALMPQFWGRGLAVEIGEKALSIAFDRFNYPSVVCYTLTGNKRSQRVMEKLGFTFEGNVSLADKPHIFYRYLNPNHSAAQLTGN